MPKARKFAAIAVALLALLFGGAWLYGANLLVSFKHLAKLVELPSAPTDTSSQKLRKTAREDGAAEPTKSHRDGVGAKAAEDAGGPNRAPVAIEVARIDPAGASVIAGRAPAGSRVSVRIGGHEIASAMSSLDGQWAVVVTQGIAGGTIDLTAVATPRDGGAPLRSAVAKLDVPLVEAPAMEDAKRSAGGENLSRQVGGPRTVAAEAELGRQDLMRFRAIVQKARDEAKSAPRQENAGGTVAAASGHRPAASGEDREAASGAESVTTVARLGGTGSDGQPKPTSVPVPITFLSDSTEMTSVGDEAAALLVEYLKLKNARAITLTGHADARGTDDYNLELSRRRLEVIERRLRAGGYKGHLALVPKGKTEPFRGIDRTAVSQEQAWQADRRVELRFIE